MTQQELFDKVCKAVIEQGEPAADALGSAQARCYYRLHKPDGKVLKCAAGHLIPDDKYSQYMEGKGLASLKAYGIVIEFPGLISQLQGAHDRAASDSIDETLHFDNARFIELFKRNAAEAAADAGLNTDVLK